ncbi:MAG: SpoIIE family protein phosphatase [Deltaproteobacteria bacterium]|nr:SpoIIE family protein phosphatase [Deltaproteobacteria bacterium]
MSDVEVGPSLSAAVSGGPVALHGPGRLAFLRTTQETASPPGKLLLIDDSPLALDTVSTFLGDMGWTVLVAPSGAEALQVASTPDLDAVIADLNMPDMNGIEVFRRLYDMDPLLPVIILSEESAMSQILETVHAGVFDFVPKSDYERMLPAAVTRAVAHGRVLRENQRLSQDLVRANEGLERRVAEQARLLEERLRREAALERDAELAPLRKEVEIARRIQTSILPAQFRVPGLQIAAQMITASEVGGDYYDVRPTADGCWLGIGDVAGHGLAAGLVMLMIQSGLSSLVLQNPGALPHEILPALNRMLYQNLRLRMGRDDHASLTMFRFFADGRLAYAGAHEEIVVCSPSGQIRTVATHGTWVGISEDISPDLESRFLALAQGDLVVLYTDGIPEARREHECYGMPRLLAEIEKRHTQPVEEILTGIMSTVLDFCAASPQDDATLLVLRYVGR